MNSASVDLIYLDPPFNSKANYAAPIGSEAAGAEFKDTWTLSDVDIAWLDLIEAKHPALNRVIHAAPGNSDKSYLIYMAVRLLEMKRLLKDTGSIYLHCDPTMSHYLKLVMDAVFGRKAFRNEIVWCYTGPSNTKRYFPRKHDTLLFFGGTNCVFNPDAVRRPYVAEYTAARGLYGRSVAEPSYEILHQRGTVPPDWWADPFLTNISAWKNERTGYPTQKPLALLKRIIKASSPEGGTVLDPFCGCATACIAAEMEHRQWAGIDIGPKAAELVRIRMDKELGMFYDGIHRTDIPKRTDIKPLRRYDDPANKKALYGEQGGNCNGCGEHFKSQNLTIDHIIARSKGGTDHIGNLQLLCGHCNSIKGNRGQEYLLAKLAA